MPNGSRKTLDKRIVAVVAAAGLLTGAIIVYYATASPPASDAETMPPLAPEHRAPYATLHPEEAAEEATPAAAGAEETVAEDDRATEPAPSAADRRAIAGAKNRAEQQGVQEYVELDEQLWLQIAVKLTIAAHNLQHHQDGRDLLLDHTAQLLADERVDPDEFYLFTKQIAETPQRAAALRERILREAEKRTQMKIEIETIPGIPQVELDLPGEED